MRVTRHGELRARKRLGISKKSVNKRAAQAKEKGTVRTEFVGSLRRYLDKYAIDYLKKGSEVYVYNDNLFVFKGEVFITAWPLPRTYRKQALIQINSLKEHKNERPN